MWLRTERESFIDAIGRRSWRFRGRFRCDRCGAEFDALRPQQLKPLKHHFCSGDCKRTFRDDRRFERQRARSVELTCDNSACGRRFVRDAKLVDRDGRCGLHFCSNACVGASAELRHVKEATCEERYGVPHPLQRPGAHAVMESTMLERHGVEHALQHPSFRDAVIRTTRGRFGVWPATLSSDVQSRIDHVERSRKLRERLLREGRVWTSRPEAELGRFLVERFGIDDVVSQVHIAGKSIDFCVRSLKLYVQMDGAFWHGLIERARTFSSVVETMRRDRELNEWFIGQDSLRLFRVSDLQWEWVVESSKHDELLSQMVGSRDSVRSFDCPVKYIDENFR